MRYGRKLLHSAEYRAAERLAQKQRLAAMTEEARVSLELHGARNAR